MDVSAPLYSPLNPDNSEIRVLRINPRANKVDIHCSLETVSLNSTGVYQALSYEWGDPDVGAPSGRVLLNSREVPTTPNLRLALAHLQSGPAYWIDALCIDQSDDKERGHQVRLMTEIYRHASAIIVWLGLEEGNSALGMDFLNEVGAFISETQKISNPGAKFHDWLYKTLLNTAYKARLDGLRQIFERSYWSRLWIIQELVVTPRPDEVRLLCGSSQARFTHLRAIVQQIRIYVEEVPRFYFMNTPEAALVELDNLAMRLRDVAVHVEAWTSTGRSKPNTEISRFLGRYSQQLCRDPRDRVYALLGVSSTYPDLELPITYTTSVRDVYKNLAKYVIQGSRKLRILLYAGLDGRVTTSNFPSWVPDWRQYDSVRRTVRVAWHSSGTLSSVVRYSADGDILTTQAFVLGPVTALLETGDFYPPVHHKQIGSIFRAGRAELAAWLHFVKSNLQLTSNAPNGMLGNAMRACYDVMFYVIHSPEEAEKGLAFKKFCRLCDQLSLPVSEFSELTHKEISYLVYAMKYEQQLCSIELASSQASSSRHGRSTSDASVQQLKATIGVCSRNGRIGDVVTVVRGCRHPLLMRPVGQRYELVGEMYVYGFMNEEALKRLPEVEIELV